MAELDYRALALDAAYLAKCAVDGTTPDPARVGEMNIDHLRVFSKKHMLVCAVGEALASAGKHTPAFDRDVAAAKYRGVMLSVYYTKVAAILEQRGIWHIPLKGYVLRDLYPSPEMRQMTDVDVLIDPDRRAEVRDIMTSLGFTVSAYGKGHHDVYDIEPDLHIEMHVCLFDTDLKEGDRPVPLGEYFGETRSRLVGEEGSSFTCRLSDDDFFIYIMAHEYSHYRLAGTGLRSLLDTYVYLKNKGKSLDMDYIEAEFAKLGISEYAKRSISLSNAVFGDGKLDASQNKALELYAVSGAQGTYEVFIRMRLDEANGEGNGAKARVLKERVFLPESTLRTVYPFFYRHKAARPLLALYRLGRAATVSRRMAFKQLRTMFLKKDEK